MNMHIITIETKKPITNVVSEIVKKTYEIPHFAMCPKCKTFMAYYPEARTYAHEDQKECDYSMTVESYIQGKIDEQE